METAFMETPLGTAKISWDGHGVGKVSILDTLPLETARMPALPSDIRSQITAYFEGRLKQFELSLNPQGSNFQRKVWEALVQIPYGKTVSYMQIAKQLGNPLGIRAVARAIGQNPLWLIIPCHRVVGSDGSLVGYAAGIWRKKWLLEHESPNPQQRLF